MQTPEPFYATFEAACGERVRGSEECAIQAWCALANVVWQSTNMVHRHEESFRTAGGLVAELRGAEGESYLTWYCSGREGVVAPWIRDAMGERGWICGPWEGERSRRDWEKHNGPIPEGWLERAPSGEEAKP